MRRLEEFLVKVDQLVLVFRDELQHLTRFVLFFAWPGLAEDFLCACPLVHLKPEAMKVCGLVLVLTELRSVSGDRGLPTTTRLADKGHLHHHRHNDLPHQHLSQYCFIMYSGFI